MLDTIAYIIGYAVIYGAMGMISLGLLVLLYWALTATLDVLSQYYLLWREKRKPVTDVTFKQAWFSSFDYQEDIWNRIWYRLKRAHGFKAEHPSMKDWKPGS
jgi:hypothetical protein